MSKIGESIEIENGFVVFYGSKQVEWWVTAMSIVCLGVKKKKVLKLVGKATEL